MNVALCTVSLCAGVAGLDLGVSLAVGRTQPLCYVEREISAAEILAARMCDGSLEAAPIWSDLATFDGGRFRGMVDILTAGFPCPDYSVAGRRAGRFGEHGQVWDHVARAIDEIRPRVAFLENVSAIALPHGSDDSEWVLPAGLWFVFGDLAAMGFDIEWNCLRASDVGAPHRRGRVFILAHARREHGDVQQWAERSKYPRGGGPMAPTPLGGQRVLREPSRREGLILGDADLAGLQRRGRVGERRGDEQSAGAGSIPLFPPGPADAEGWRRLLAEYPWLAPAVESGVRGDVDGMALVVDANRADQLRAIGNGVVAIQGAAAFIELSRRAGIDWGADG